MHDSLIAWMITGGDRFETTAERMDRDHVRALREQRAAGGPTGAGRRAALARIRARAMTVLGLASPTIAAPTTTPDCCGA
ncbi:MAG: hypothetical protein ACLGIJ_00295 [Candidatus Limnocylindria bacterium]